MSRRILIAGVGNIFFGDDAFGCEVVKRLASEPLPPEVRLEDYGIRGTHLAFELLSGYDGAILLDAVSRGGAPGTLYVIEPDLDGSGAIPDAHGMDLGNVFTFIKALDGTPPRVLIVGCEATAQREEMGLSDDVARAVDAAVPLVREVLEKYFVETRTPAGGIL